MATTRSRTASKATAAPKKRKQRKAATPDLVVLDIGDILEEAGKLDPVNPVEVEGGTPCWSCGNPAMAPKVFDTGSAGQECARCGATQIPKVGR
jgi:hypothetical protein